MESTLSGILVLIFLILVSLVFYMFKKIADSEQKIRNGKDSKELKLLEEKLFRFWLRNPFSQRWRSFGTNALNQEFKKIRKMSLVQFWCYNAFWMIIPPLNKFLLVSVLYKGHDLVDGAEGSDRLLVDIDNLLYFQFGYLTWCFTFLGLYYLITKRFEKVDRIIDLRNYLFKLRFVTNSWIEKVKESDQKNVRAFQRSFQLLFLWFALSCTYVGYLLVK